MLYWMSGRRKFLKVLSKQFLKGITKEKEEDFRNQPDLKRELKFILDDVEILENWLNFDLRKILIEENYIKIKPVPLIASLNKRTYWKYEILDKWSFLLNIWFCKKIDYFARDYPYIVWWLTFWIVWWVIWWIITKLLVW